MKRSEESILSTPKMLRSWCASTKSFSGNFDILLESFQGLEGAGWMAKRTANAHVV